MCQTTSGRIAAVKAGMSRGERVEEAAEHMAAGVFRGAQLSLIPPPGAGHEPLAEVFPGSTSRGHARCAVVVAGSQALPRRAVDAGRRRVHPRGAPQGTFTPTLMLAFSFFAPAALHFYVCETERATPGAGPVAIDGVLAVLLGLLIVADLPSSAAWAPGLLVGVNLLFFAVRAMPEPDPTAHARRAGRPAWTS